MSLAMPMSHRARAFVIVVALLACAVAVGLAPLRADASVDYVFNVNCPLSHFGSDDPIVAPGLPGSSHRHAFYGNTSTDAFSTTASLKDSKSTCERGFATADRSAYWVPSLYRKVPGSTFREVHLDADDQHLSAYYRRSGGPAGVKVKPFPQGLRMVAGDPVATKPQNIMDAAWRCNGASGAYDSDIPNCPAGTTLQALISFPDCWDGINLDSADHRSHMTYSSGERGTCPKAHPVKLPQLSFEVSFDLQPIVGASYELASGGRYSLHGDFFAAWDDKVQSALVNSCLNGGRYCENPQRSGVDLTAAGPVGQGREPAGVKPSPSPSPTPVPDGDAAIGTAATAATAAPAAAPATTPVAQTRPRPVLLGAVAAAAITVVGAAFLLLRRRRRPVGAKRTVDHHRAAN